jgi:protein SCO1/2
MSQKSIRSFFGARKKDPILFLALTLLLGAGAALAATPGDSVYQLQAQLEDQSGAKVGLDRYRGQPVIISMFYGTCPHVCPMLISTIQRYERELPEAQRGQLRVLMVSIDPKRDTPAHLAEVAARHRVDASRWTLARTDAASVRKLAAVLNIQYRELPDGEFNHSTVITVLDRDGRPLRATSSMLRPDAEFSAALKAATTGR